ncbi:hypothetical protein AAHA92_09991 [Salvia divinorum]|uniref:Uncharacterized protein n=1 Tax=Salvia divinorum TaxID=28513 RepID=A0ABD1HX84_SALDI
MPKMRHKLFTEGECSLDKDPSYVSSRFYYEQGLSEDPEPKIELHQPLRPGQKNVNPSASPHLSSCGSTNKDDWRNPFLDHNRPMFYAIYSEEKIALDWSTDNDVEDKDAINTTTTAFQPPPAREAPHSLIKELTIDQLRMTRVVPRTLNDPTSRFTSKTHISNATVFLDIILERTHWLC